MKASASRRFDFVSFQIGFWLVAVMTEAPHVVWWHVVLLFGNAVIALHDALVRRAVRPSVGPTAVDVSRLGTSTSTFRDCHFGGAE